MSAKAIQQFHTGYSSEKSKESVLSPQAGKQIHLFNLRLLNRSGTTSDIGMLRKLAESARKVFYFDGLVATEITDNMNNGVDSVIADTVVDSGFYVQAKRTFSLVSILVVTQQTSAPTQALEYWNGSSWVAIPDLIEVLDLSTSGNKILFFSAPFDWVAGDGGVAGLDPSYYSIRSTYAAGGNSPAASAMSVASLIDFAPGVPDGAAVESNWSVEYPLILEADEGILPYFGVASQKNQVKAFYSQSN